MLSVPLKPGRADCSNHKPVRRPERAMPEVWDEKLFKHIPNMIKPATKLPYKLQSHHVKGPYTINSPGLCKTYARSSFKIL